MKRVLITGIAGFIGSHTCEHILAKTDWEIVGLDSLTYAGDVARLTESNVYDPARVSIHWHDLRAPISQRLDDRIGPIDYVLNIASESHVDRSIEDPAPFITSNTALMVNMMEWARKRVREAGAAYSDTYSRKLKTFIHISTDEVYGPAPAGYSHHEWDRILPSNPYSASKAAQEAIGISYWRTFGVPLVITNTMNNFGERQDAEKFIPKTLKHILNNEPVLIHAAKYRRMMPIYGGIGEPPREFKRSPIEWEAGSRVWLHARNHADALLWILQNTKPAEFGRGDDVPDRYNVAGDRDLPNDQLARIIGEILGLPVRLDYQDFHASRPGHDLRYSLEDSKLKSLGWKPPLSFEDSLRKTIEWTLAHQAWLN